MSPMVQRQPKVPPIHAPRGVPRTEATDQPRKTKVMPRPLWCSGTSRPMQAAAWGVNTAAEAMASIRVTSRPSKPGAMAASACKAAYQMRLPTNNFRRSQRVTSMASEGAPRLTSNAELEISCPAVLMDTPRSLRISCRRPAITITPMPMTTLPNISGHSTAGKR